MMNEKINKAVGLLISPLSGFEQARLEELEEGHSVISIDITDTSLNALGNVHGGFIFTLCDISAGIITASHSRVGVTLNSSINYLKGLNSGTLYFEANTLHKGKTTIVLNVKVTNQDGVRVADATFTMCVLKEL